MTDKTSFLTSKLFEKDFISKAQFDDFKEYKAKNIFSLNTELLFLMYTSVLLFTSGIGVLVYQNIDSIGHLAILAFVLVLTVLCFYFSFKNASAFSKLETKFKNPIYDYVVLTGSILACIFLGYAQFQYAIFGLDYKWVSLSTALICFFIAYYFDSRMVLSIALTALTTFIGITLTPQRVFENEFMSNPALLFTGIALGTLFVVWTLYAEKNELKKHFHFVFYTFAQHLIGICCLSGLFQNQWYLFLPVFVGFIYYFYKLSYVTFATSLFVFTLLYGFVGSIALLVKLFDNSSLFDFLIMFSPVYFIGSILAFISLVKKFNKEKHASIS